MSSALSENNKAILEYLKSDEKGIELSKKQNELLRRYQKAYAMLLKYKSKKVVADMLSKLDDWNSVHTAYNDLRMCEAIFGNLNDSSKSMKRQIATEMSLEVFNIAKANKDLDQMNKAIKNYIVANGLNKDEIDLPDFENLEIPQDPIVIDIEFLQKYSGKIEQNILDKIAKVLMASKIFDYIPEFAEDVPFIEVKNKSLNE